MEKTQSLTVTVGANVKKSQNDSDKKAISTSDMTRRMVCGGLAGMVAKVGSAIILGRFPFGQTLFSNFALFPDCYQPFGTN